MSKAGEQQSELLNEGTIDYARDLVLAAQGPIRETMEVVKGTDVNAQLAWMLAHGSLLISLCRELDVHPMLALNAAETALGSKPSSSTTIH